MKKIKQIICSLLLIVTAFSVFFKGDILTSLATLNVGTSVSTEENNVDLTQKEEQPSNAPISVTVDGLYAFLTRDREEWDSVNP